jgi:hypothetical protein
MSDALNAPENAVHARRDLHITPIKPPRPPAHLVQHISAGASAKLDGERRLYETGTFNFARLSRWLDDNVALDAGD